MAFYDEISKYYDKIFPVSKNTIDFLANSIGRPPKSILDVACGTGSYAIELGKIYHDITAIDLDSKMIEDLKTKINNSQSKIKFSQGNMLELCKKFQKASFEGIYCIGNSLVHLDNISEIKKFFMDIKTLLKKDGVFIFQIINYNKVISKHINELPTIIDESVPLKFERFYEYKKDLNKIIFKTILSIETKKIENAIYLTPLTYEDAILLLREAGFNKIKVYGDFNKNNFQKNESYALIVEAKL